MWRNQRDPVTRFRRFLEYQKLWDDDKEQKLQADCKAEVGAALEEAEKSPVPEPLSVFDHTYERLTPHLESERKELAAELGIG